MDDSHVSGLDDSEEYSDSELVDRLSELPDTLILEILSFLPTRDVVTTTLLSKRWENLWTTVPALNFRIPAFNGLDEFRFFVIPVLARWRGAKIRKFSLIFTTELPTSYLDLLLQFVIEKQVEELHIELISIDLSLAAMTNYSAPQSQCLYSCSSITKLIFVSFTMNIVESVRWNQLKSLTIYGANSLTEQAMSQILSGSPQLEVLNLCIIESGENLNIVSSSLKMLVIEMYPGHNEGKSTVLRICAPNLESLEIHGVSYSMCLLDVPSLSNVVLGFDERDWFVSIEEMLWKLLLSICHVQKLALTDCCIKFLLEMKKKDMVVMFSDAKFLKFYPGEAGGMLDVLEIFPELRILVIQHNEVLLLFTFAIISLFKEEEEEEEEPCIAMVDACDTLASKATLPTHSLLHLKTVEITWHLRDASIIPVIKVLLENAPVLERMVLRLRTHGADPEMFVMAEEKMLSMPRSSPNAEGIAVPINDCEAEADIELVDRLSELPDDVIQEILSFLPMRVVVKTALLAKRWEDLWKTVPCFDFRYSAENDLDKFKSFIKQAVSLWRGAKIRKLSLSYMFDPLLRFAVEHQVEEVSIEETKRFEYYNEYEEEDYCIPQCVYSCSSITKITISPFESHILDNVRWNKLESLTLQGADVWIEDAMSQILSGCPRLEVLNLFMRETGSGSFIDIQSRSLKMLVIEMHAPRSSYYESKGAMMRIQACNLESLEIYGFSYEGCLLDAPSLSSAVLGFDESDWFMFLGVTLQQLFVSICHVQKLSFTDWCIKFLLEMRKKDMDIQFSNAKFLKMYPGEADGIFDVLDIFPELRTLVIQHNEIASLFRNEEEPCITVAPKAVFLSHPFLHLKTVEITWHLCDASIIPIVKFLFEHAHVLEKMVLRLRTEGADPGVLVLAEKKMMEYAEILP